MCPGEDFQKIRQFRHYRSPKDIGGRDLCTFSSVKELATAIRDATIEHDDVVFEARVSHRDISVSNVIITSGTGLLIDWDLCKVMDSASEDKEHAIERIGTW
ncbi:hypothetical protein AX14_006492 [Amanita brunnescens Koide BX004]|nr:hypothetical protein AX14_006492 [Amanita brunnescens Koide BX004]